MPIIEVKDLVRDYTITSGLVRRNKKTINAVRGISFSVERGEIFGLLGQNGAGKTTTIKMLITMLAPTSGTCKVLGYNTFGQEKMIRDKVNFIFGGEYGLYRRLSARDNLKYFANLYKVPLDTRDKYIDELLEMVGLSDRADTRVETFSKGMTQRVQIARGLINNPEVLFLDEPTVGLDPLGAETLRGIVKEANKRGTTILLTTHNMYEADELCNRIAIIKDGVFLDLDTPANIKARSDTKTTLEITLTKNPLNIATISGVSHVASSEKDGLTSLRVSCQSDNAISQVLAVIEPTTIKSFKNEVATLEDAYIQLVKGASE
ncbi:MAG: ABC transporter ATP-binding protein [Defluviitaleaceae bacterium]|nr:ABC transporter ATP-binding protein [Defluviitaleaceae bacterium]